MTFVLLPGPTLRHVLVIGVDGVRFDLLGLDTTPSIWDLGRSGFLAPALALAEDGGPLFAEASR